MKKLLIAAGLALAVLTAACTPQQQLIADGVRVKLASGADAKLDKDVWSLCETNSTGAIFRKIKKDPTWGEAYGAMCVH